jgi:hypothetical protein
MELNVVDGSTIRLPFLCNRNNGERHACHRERSYQFVIAVWSTKAAQSESKCATGKRLLTSSVRPVGLGAVSLAPRRRSGKGGFLKLSA